MKRLCAVIIATCVLLALAAPAAAAGPSDGSADRGSGWSWSSVVEWLGGWADGLRLVVAGSQTGGGEAGDDDPATAGGSPDETLSTTGPDTTDTNARWEIDPDG